METFLEAKPKRNKKRALRRGRRGRRAKGPLQPAAVRSHHGSVLWQGPAPRLHREAPVPHTNALLSLGHSTLCDVSFMTSVTWLSFDSDGAQPRSRHAPFVWLDADSRRVRASPSGNATAPDAHARSSQPCHPRAAELGGPQPSSLSLSLNRACCPGERRDGSPTHRLSCSCPRAVKLESAPVSSAMARDERLPGAGQAARHSQARGWCRCS